MVRRTVAVGLTPEQIVETALALMDAHGVDWLTMRRLADELGVQAPTLYWHVRNRSDLIDAAIDAALAECGTVSSEAGDWQGQVWDYMHTLRRQLTAHPSVTDMMRNRYPSSVHQLSIQAVEIAASIGLPPAETATRARLMIWRVVGFATMENNIRLGTAYHEPVVDGTTYTVTAPPGTAHPPVHPEIVGHLGVLDLDELFDLDVEVFVAGLEELSRHRRSTRP